MRPVPDKPIKLSGSPTDVVQKHHHRMQVRDVFSKNVEQYEVFCSGEPNKRYIWRPGDLEPEWRCPLLKELES